ncbi:hypothetical protein JHW43_004592 [Diplocarpon mali]|nr:hypothetical protein JHW43_004592 [Diplocarpon mali]
MDAIKAYLESEFAAARKNAMFVSPSNISAPGPKYNNASLSDSDISESDSQALFSESNTSASKEEAIFPPMIITRESGTYDRKWRCKECTEEGKCIYCDWTGLLSAPLPADVNDSEAYLKWLACRGEISLREVYSEDDDLGHGAWVFVFLPSDGFSEDAIVQRYASAGTKEAALRQAADGVVGDLRPLIG